MLKSTTKQPLTASPSGQRMQLRDSMHRQYFWWQLWYKNWDNNWLHQVSYDNHYHSQNCKKISQLQTTDDPPNKTQIQEETTSLSLRDINRSVKNRIKKVKLACKDKLEQDFRSMNTRQAFQKVKTLESLRKQALLHLLTPTRSPKTWTILMSGTHPAHMPKTLHPSLPYLHQLPVSRNCGQFQVPRHYFGQ